jgi:hypothetical protein
MALSARRLPSRSFGSRRARFPALNGTVKALRLPTRASTVAYLFRFRCPRDPSCFVSAVALLQARRSLAGPGLSFRRLTRRSGFSRVDACGISQVFRRSILCLCRGPRPRSNRRVLATAGHVDAAPATQTAKASAMADVGAKPAASAPAPLRFAPTLPHTRKDRFRPAGWAFTGRASNPLDRYERFQLV